MREPLSLWRSHRGRRPVHRSAAGLDAPVLLQHLFWDLGVDLVDSARLQLHGRPPAWTSVQIPYYCQWLGHRRVNGSRAGVDRRVLQSAPRTSDWPTMSSPDRLATLPTGQPLRRIPAANRCRTHRLVAARRGPRAPPEASVQTATPPPPPQMRRFRRQPGPWVWVAATGAGTGCATSGAPGMWIEPRPGGSTSGALGAARRRVGLSPGGLAAVAAPIATRSPATAPRS